MSGAATDRRTTIGDIPLGRIDGSQDSLARHRGHVLLIVNVASKCGLTAQYAGLEALYRDRKAQCFEILGFPANDFRGQEPGSDEEIAAFCSLTYDVTFPLYRKISVKGDAIHPLYRALTAAIPQAVGADAMRERLDSHGLAGGDRSEVLWNFEKFLVGRDGRVLGRFSPSMAAEDPRLLAALDRALAEPTS